MAKITLDLDTVFEPGDYDELGLSVKQVLLQEIKKALRKSIEHDTRFATLVGQIRDEVFEGAWRILTTSPKKQ